MDGFIIDIVRGDLLVEIQTRNFSAIRRKLARLAVWHPVRPVCPPGTSGSSKRTERTPASQAGASPKQGRIKDVFAELVSLPLLLTPANFSIEILLIQEEEVRRPNSARGGARNGSRTNAVF